MSVTSLRRAMLGACLIVCVLSPGAVAEASARTDRLEAGIVRAMNDYRAKHGLPKLRQQRGFARAADAHSAAMLRQNTLKHGNYSQRVRRYVRRVSAWARTSRGCGAATRATSCDVGAFSGHRRVMLSRSFRRVGVAQRSRSNACFVTADFGTAR